MFKTLALMTAAFATATFAAAPIKLPPHTPLISDGKVVVDSTDFEGNLLRLPESKRDEMRMTQERVATIVDNMFIARALATRARDLGLDKDPAVQKRLLQVQDGVLADLYVQKVEKEVAIANLEQRARELYKAEQAKYVTKEEVYVQHILVNLAGRTRDTALERARKAAEEARAGEDFLAVATRYSDDPDKRKNGGNLGYNSPTSFVEPVRKAIGAMKIEGEIVGPVESEFGYHVLKFVDRKPAKPIPYEAVAKKIIESERERLRKQRTDALVAEVHNSPSVVIHRENVEKLVIPVDPEIARKAMEEKSAAPK
ncbi:MAG: peptidylprolyl isomerase [Usitatibacter sp.]